MGEDAYTTRMEPRAVAGEPVDIGAIADAVSERWYNETVYRVNDSYVRLAVVQGEYHWHHHDDGDEFFYVVDGHLFIEVEGRATVELGPRQAFTVPRGIGHRPLAPERTVMLMVETSAVSPTGD